MLSITNIIKEGENSHTSLCKDYNNEILTVKQILQDIYAVSSKQ